MTVFKESKADVLNTSLNIDKGILKVGSFTTAEKTALTAENGDIVYDSTLNKFQGYEAGAWASFI